MMPVYFSILYSKLAQTVYVSRGSPGKNCIPGVKIHVTGVASTCGHEKQPTPTVIKKPNSTGIVDLATL